MGWTDPAARRAYANAWYAKNRERVCAQRNAWAKANPEKRKLTTRAASIKSKFGLSLEQWDSLFQAQDRRCAICRTDYHGGIGWQTDHCHRSDKVRQILCLLCNTGLGKFKDSPALLRTAAEYLERHAD